jgi:cholesterol transport system auxiliary component
MRYFPLIILSLVITACSPLGPVKTVPVSTYALSATDAGVSKQASRSSAVLLVTAPTSAPGYQTNNMLYTQRPFELSYFSHSRWVASPAEMLGPLLVQSLQASGCFRAVVSPPFSSHADLILDTRLLNLQQEFKEGTSQLRLTLAVTLQDTQAHEVITSQRIEAVVPAIQANPYAGVIAANKAVSIVLNRVISIACREHPL